MATYHAILYISSGSVRTLVRHVGGWSEGAAPEGALWYIVTNLIDERFVLVDLPALNGRDRRDFLEAKLVALFSDSPYRTALPYQAAAGQQNPVFTGIAGAYVEEAIQNLADTGANIVGVWTLPTLLMNALVHQRRTLPSTLLAMLPTSEGMRMQFIDRWQPVLTRLLPLGLNADRLIEEVLRTRQYLVDSKNVANEEALPLLVVDDGHGWAAQLETQAFRVYRPWKSKSVQEILDILLDGVLKEPAGQLAPVELRQVHIASRLRRAMVRGTIGLSVLSLALAGYLALTSFKQYQFVDMLRRDVEVLRTQTAQQNMEQTKFQEGVIDAVGHLVKGELSVQEAAPEFLQGLSAALSQQDQVRVSRIEWRYLGQGVPCADDTKNAAATSAGLMASIGLPSGPAGSPTVPVDAPSGPAFPLEIVVGLKLPPPSSPLGIGRRQLALVDSLSQETGLKGKLQKGLVSLDNDFSGGSDSSAASGAQSSGVEMTVCLTPSQAGGDKR